MKSDWLPMPALGPYRKDPKLHFWVMSVLEQAFFWGDNHPAMLGGAGEG